MKKKFILTLALTALAIPMATSCAGNADDGKYHEFSGDPKSLKADISFWHTMAKAMQTDWLEPLITQFNQLFPNITVTAQAQGGYDDVRDKLTKAIAAGTEPCMAFCYPDHVSLYVDAGASLAMDGFMNDPTIGYGKAITNGTVALKDDTKEDLEQTYLNEGNIFDADKNYYMLPFAKSSEMLFYNESYFAEKGYDVPTAWENPDDPNDLSTVMGIARAIKLEEPDSIPVGYGDDANMFITFAAQFDVPYTQNVEGNKFPFATSLKSKALMQKFVDWQKEGLIGTEGTLEVQPNTYLTEKKSYMCVGSTGGVKYHVSDQQGENEKFITGVAEIPSGKLHLKYDSYEETVTGKQKAISQGPSICFFKRTTWEQRYATWLFYRFLTTTTATLGYTSGTGYNPIRTSAYSTSKYADLSNVAANPPDLEDYQKNLAYAKAKSLSLVPNYSKNDCYFVSAAFKGSSAARTEIGKILKQVTFSGWTIDRAFEAAYSACQLAS